MSGPTPDQCMEMARSNGAESAAYAHNAKADAAGLLAIAAAINVASAVLANLVEAIRTKGE